MSRKKDVSGVRFNHLTAVSPAPSKGGKSRWLCRCDCGNEAVVYLSDLRTQKVKSCGCLRRNTAAEQGKQKNTKHGMTGTRLWVIWSGMKARSKRNPQYKNVDVCAEWMSNFQSFYDWAIANGYADNLTIDRKDNSSGYSPDNCRWVTMKEQQNNRTNNVFVEINGKKMSLTELCETSGIPRATLQWRIKAGWPEKDLLLPVNLNNARIRKENENA